MRLPLLALALGIGLAAPASHAQAPKPGVPGAAAPGAAVPVGEPITPRQMLAHRAAYRLTLDRARDGSGVAQANGAMAYEVIDACDGWTTRQRFTLTLTDRDGTEIETTSDYSTYESKDGRSLRYTLTQTTQGAVTQRVAGEAEVTPEGGLARYSEPEQKEVPLPRGTILPTVHTIATLNAARQGQRIFESPLFDGTSPDGAQDSTTVLSPWQAAQANERFPLLAPLGSARMRIAFFDRGQAQSGGAGTPDYEVSLRYWENGVADELRMDFGEFVVQGELLELAPVPGGC